MAKSSKSIKCSDCGEPLTEEMKECPKCGSRKRSIMVTVTETISFSESLGLKKKSGQKDDRGKPIREERIKVKGGTETKMTIDRSKRLEGLPITDVTHEVIKNGKTVHGPHLEPKGKRKSARILGWDNRNSLPSEAVLEFCLVGSCPYESQASYPQR